MPQPWEADEVLGLVLRRSHGLWAGSLPVPAERRGGGVHEGVRPHGVARGNDAGDDDAPGRCQRGEPAVWIRSPAHKKGHVRTALREESAMSSMQRTDRHGGA